MFTEWLRNRYGTMMLDADDGTDAPNTEQGQEPKPKTLDDILKENPEFQKEFDRRMSKGLETGKAKWQKEAEEKAAHEKSEAERLAAMTAEQRAEESYKKREGELTKREQELLRREMKATARDTLTERGLPAELLDSLDLSSAENCTASIDRIEKAFRSAVQKGVEDRMGGRTPRVGGNQTKPDYDKMSDEEYYAAKEREKREKREKTR